MIDFYLKEASSQGRMGGVACSKSHQGTHFGPGTMNLAFIFKEEKVPSEIADPLAAALTVHSFACLAPSASELEDVVKGALDASLHAKLTVVVWACLKASFHKCLSSIVSASGGGTSAGPSIPHSATSSSSWVDTFPAKLSQERLNTLKTQFEKDYPSKILDPSSLPSSRMLALAKKHVTEKSFAYIAWKYRMSEEKLEESGSSRPRKLARLEDYIFDEVPARDIPEGVSQMLLLHLLDLVAFAYCLLGAAHLSSFRAYSIAESPHAMEA